MTKQVPLIIKDASVLTAGFVIRTGNTMKLSEKIRILRKARGLSQEEFGYSLSEATDGVSRQTISDWENGKFEPKLDNIRDIAKVLDVSFDVLLDESIDLNDAQTLQSVLHNVTSDLKKTINTKIRYDICQYRLEKKDYIKLSIRIAILAIVLISIMLVSVGLWLSITPLYIGGAIFGGLSLIVMPTAIIGLISFIKAYKMPYGIKVGEINNTHLIIQAYQKASNVIYLPIEKIKSVSVADDTALRHGDVIISLLGREQPIRLLNVAFPHHLVEFYTQLLQINESDDLIKII